jgi:hypothetical protein
MNLSEKQISRIQYECMLMKRAPQELQVIAPWLFIEGVTAANTEVVEPIKVEEKKVETTTEKDFYSMTDEEFRQECLDILREWP